MCAVAEAGEFDLLVANAGVNLWRRPSWEIDPVDWWRVYEVNVLGVHLCCRAVIPGMLERATALLPAYGPTPIAAAPQSSRSAGSPNPIARHNAAELSWGVS